MKNLKQTIKTLEQIASDTEDFDTAISIQELNSDLRLSCKEKTRKWHNPSIVIGLIFGVALSVLFCSDVEADEINVHISSWHSKYRDYFNSENYGLGYSYDINPNLQAKAGGYINSFKKDSFYISLNYHQNYCEYCLGVQIGGVTGYDNVVTKKSPDAVKNLSSLQFVILPTVTARYDKHHSFTLGYIPAFNKKPVSIATLTYNYRF